MSCFTYRPDGNKWQDLTQKKEEEKCYINIAIQPLTPTRNDHKVYTGHFIREERKKGRSTFDLYSLFNDLWAERISIIPFNITMTRLTPTLFPLPSSPSHTLFPDLIVPRGQIKQTFC